MFLIGDVVHSTSVAVENETGYENSKGTSISVSVVHISCTAAVNPDSSVVHSPAAQSHPGSTPQS